VNSVEFLIQRRQCLSDDYLVKLRVGVYVARLLLAEIVIIFVAFNEGRRYNLLGVSLSMMVSFLYMSLINKRNLISHWHSAVRLVLQLKIQRLIWFWAFLRFSNFRIWTKPL